MKFKYIHDSALEIEAENETCHVCETTQQELFSYQGIIELPDGSEEDVFYVCESCIKSGKTRHMTDFEAIECIDNYLNRQNLDDFTRNQKRSELIEAYQKTPGIPIYQQGFDQPFCCLDMTQFIGYPENEKDLIHISKNYTYWYQEPQEDNEMADFSEGGEPESMRDLAKFECLHCKSKYYTFYPT